MADANASSGPQTGDSPRGFAFALTAYVLWGFLPFFMKAVAHIPPSEVVAHRIIWSVPLAGLVLVWLGRTSEIKTALRERKISSDPMSTGAAVRTFNVMLAEGRAVAAALIAV